MSELLQNLGIDWRLLLAQIINFALLLFILKKILYGPLAKFLETRRATIEQGLENAKNIQHKLKEIDLEKRQALLEARTEAVKLSAAAKVAAQNEAEGILTEARTRAEATLEDARQKLKGDKEKIVAEARGEITQLALTLTQKVLAGVDSTDLAQRAAQKALRIME